MSDTPAAKKLKDDIDPDAFMMRAKDGLTKQREEVMARRAAIDEELAAIDGKLERIENYFNPGNVVGGKAPRVTRKAFATGTRRTGVRDDVLAAIKRRPDGISRQDLLKAMDATEKSREQSISNAVAALKKEGKITTGQGHYKAA
ncbi:hypothetical protein [Rhodovarius lipocyclicus]|uniref:hypothetical protein n=1 Tax=Rhodovarius lipocyclicus TaxID=268410 RepID=UPI00135BA0B1|nr:hypothetical protein [Rhodovarius lipocyclicus]